VYFVTTLFLIKSWAKQSLYNCVLKDNVEKPLACLLFGEASHLE